MSINMASMDLSVMLFMFGVLALKHNYIAHVDIHVSWLIDPLETSCIRKNILDSVILKQVQYLWNLYAQLCCFKASIHYLVLMFRFVYLATKSSSVRLQLLKASSYSRGAIVYAWAGCHYSLNLLRSLLSMNNSSIFYFIILLPNLIHYLKLY